MQVANSQAIALAIVEMIAKKRVRRKPVAQCALDPLDVVLVSHTVAETVAAVVGGSKVVAEAGYAQHPQIGGTMQLLN